MKLVTTSLENGRLEHKEIELPEGFLDLTLELETGVMIQINVSDDESEFQIRETTFRRLSIEPSSSNSVTIRGI